MARDGATWMRSARQSCCRNESSGAARLKIVDAVRARAIGQRQHALGRQIGHHQLDPFAASPSSAAARFVPLRTGTSIEFEVLPLQVSGRVVVVERQGRARQPCVRCRLVEQRDRRMACHRTEVADHDRRLIRAGRRRQKRRGKQQRNRMAPAYAVALISIWTFHPPKVMQPAICRKSPRSCGRPRCASSRGSPHPDRADSECLRPLPRLVVTAPKRDQSVEHHRVGWQIDDPRLRPLPQDALPVHAPPSATAATTCQAKDAQTPDAACPPVSHHEIFAIRSVPISRLTPVPSSKARTGSVAADRLTFIPAASVLNRDDRGRPYAGDPRRNGRADRGQTAGQHRPFLVEPAAGFGAIRAHDRIRLAPDPPGREAETLFRPKSRRSICSGGRARHRTRP